MDASLQQALDRLYGLHAFGIKFGLETVEAILGFMGNPERSFAAVHVAGTNGKGSVCAMIESVLRRAGWGTTGLYTSPHLVRFNERIRVGGEAVSDEELAALMASAERAMSQAADLPGGRQATFFEATTAMAFEHFRRKGVKLAVVETGLGGRLDATNVVLPILSVITPVSIEHTAYLGKELAGIAGEKAGIIKPGRPVICGTMPLEADAVIERTARERKARLIRAAEAVSVRRVSQSLAGQKVKIESAEKDYGTALLPLLGAHQLSNCGMAVAAIEEIVSALSLELEPEAVKEGLAAMKWPGRCQVLQEKPPVFLDGAHNPGAAEALAKTLAEVLKKKPLGLVVGMCGDKDAPGFFRPFAGIGRRCWTVPMKTERGVPPAELAKVARLAGLDAAAAELGVALDQAAAWAEANAGAVCITGSLFLVGEVLEMKGIRV